MDILDSHKASLGHGPWLFVYGTLKKRQINHELLNAARSVSNGHTVKQFLMMDAGDFPVALEQDNGLAAMLPIVGELYEIEDRLLVTLDQFEDLGGMYDRGFFSIRLPTGAIVPAIMYVGRPQYWKNISTLEVVKTYGDFYAWPGLPEKSP